MTSVSLQHLLTKINELEADLQQAKSAASPIAYHISINRILIFLEIDILDAIDGGL
jgi:hypothetical protein